MGFVINLNRVSLDETLIIVQSNIGMFVMMFIACVIISMALTALATYIPARRAANLSPAEALRYEN